MTDGGPAVEPVVAVSVTASGAVGRDGELPGTGGVLGLGVEGTLGRVGLEAHARSGVFADLHVGADAFAAARFWVTPPALDTGLSLFAGAGAGVVPVVTPRVWVGADFAWWRARAVSGRAGVAYQVLDVGEAGAELHLSLVWQPGARRATPTPVVEAPPPPALPEVDPRMVWAPHPICAWVPAASAATTLADAPAGLPLRLEAPGTLPADVTREDAATTVLVAAPVQGGVVVAGTHGDLLIVRDGTLAIPTSGAAVLTAAEGAFTATVVGGGRSATVEGAVVDGFVLWLHADPAPTEVVPFALDDATVDAPSRVVLARLARHRGDHRYEVRGGYSPEGDRARNTALADRRADAVRDELIAAGVPADRVAVVPAAMGVADAAGRVAHVVPLPPQPAERP